MIKITSGIINSAKKVETADEKILSAMVERSKEIMEEFGTLFKSKTLEKLYTPEYNYNGPLPNATYIIDKKTGKRKLIFINSHTSSQQKSCEETYTARTIQLKNLGSKSFTTILDEGRIKSGVMESKANDRYAGTQIRLTQVEVERAIQINENNIPLVSVPEALPFHCMMGFRPDKQYSREVRNLADVEKEMHILTSRSALKKEFFTPIIHYKDGKYYFDSNQTLANATLRFFKKETDEGIERNYHAIFPGNSVDMNLSGKELEAWKQRALSQPIFLKKSGKDI